MPESRGTRPTTPLQARRPRPQFQLDPSSTIVDEDSNMRETACDLNARIAGNVRRIRAERGLSLDALAAGSGVSRSMISRVERGESSPTAVLLERIASGLGVVLSSLFEATGGMDGPNPLSRRRDQALWRDPASGYVRRNVSPSGGSRRVQIVEVRFPAGARVAFENTRRRGRVDQQVWVLEGSIDLTVGETRHRLEEGDCLAMGLDAPTMFHNPNKTAVRYAVVTESDPLPIP